MLLGPLKVSRVVSPSPESNVPAPSGLSPNLKADLALLWAPLLGLSPLLLSQASLSWSKPHLQYFPLSLLAFAWLLRQEFLLERTWAVGKRRLAGFALFFLALLGGGIGFWFYSPFIGSAAAVLIVAAWGLLTLPSTRLSRLLAVLAILVSCLPLPLNWDQNVVDSLQTMASRGTSYALDGLEIPHLPQGNVIQIPDHSLFVEEACSGVTSLYSLVSIAIIFLVYSRRSLLISLATIAFIPLVAIATNLLRLLSIALFLYWWDIDISHGYAHTILGFVTFLIGISTVLCLERFFSVFFAPITTDRASETFLVPIYNGLVSWPKASAVASASAKAAASSAGTSTAEATSVGKKLAGPPSSLTADLPRWLPGLSYGFAGVMLLGFALLNWYLNFQPILKIPDVSDELAAEFASKDSLPATMGDGWQKLDFKFEKRDMASVFGQRSNTWYYRNDESTYILSLDYPFRGWHPLEVCYVKSGWEVSSFVTGQDKKQVQPPWIEIEFVNQLGGNGFLIYSFFDEKGQPYIGGSVESRAEKNILNILSNYKDSYRPITYQCQLFTESWKPLTEEEKQKMRLIYFEARQQIREKSATAMQKIED